MRLRTGDRAGAAREVATIADRLDVAAAGPWMEADLALRCAEISLEVGEIDRAVLLVDRARRALSRFPDAGTMPDRLRVIERRAEQVNPRLDALTPAERRVLPHLASHLTLSKIAEQLFISRSTVKTHVSSIYSKLGVSSRTEAVDVLQSSPLDPDLPG